MSDHSQDSIKNVKQSSEEENNSYPALDLNFNDLNKSKVDDNENVDNSSFLAETNTTLSDSSYDSKIISELNNNDDYHAIQEKHSSEKAYLPELKSDSNHIVLYELPLISNEVPKASKEKFENENVLKAKLPFNEFIKCIEVKNGVRRIKSDQKNCWELIEENLIGLSEGVDSLKDLEKAIKNYNFRIKNSNFDVLHKLSSDDKKIIPKLIKLGLQLPVIIPHSIPLLCQRENKTIFMSQHQISCILANAFLCTFPQTMELCPSINFNNLFTKNVSRKNDSSIKLEKLKCIMNYFKRVLSEPLKGVVSFERRFLETNQFPKWNKSSKQLSKLKVIDKGTIESEGKGMLQVDFANKLVGGGVLNHGCVQEEIRFCINPELIVSRLFTQQLLDEEVLIIKGSEQFSTYDGYGNSFEWGEDFKDLSNTDDWSRKTTTIVAMDAIRFASDKIFIQYDLKNLNRELNKAYCGFEDRKNDKTPIATGNWGCGAFNGDKVFKACIQLMAASQCERDLYYFTFNDSSLKKELDKFYSFICHKDLRVRDLYRALQLYDGQVIKSSKSYKKDLIEFITVFINSNNKL